MLNIDKLTKEERYEIIASQHKDTEAEIEFKALLDNKNIEYKQEVQFGKYRADFVINDMIVEVNGSYHYTPAQRKKDKTRAMYLLKHFRVEIKEITNEQVFRCKNKEIELEELLKIDDRCIKDKIEVKKPASAKIALTESQLEFKEAMKKKAKARRHDEYMRKKEFINQWRKK